MHPVLEDLIHLLRLERLEDNIFRGGSRDIGSRQVFGGQVLGQAMSAANYTVADRVVHSLHAYFLRSGDMHAPIVYQVERVRDGRSFSTRRVVAIQHGRPIFTMSASFQISEEGIEHQSAMPDVPGPDGLSDVTDLDAETLDKIPQKMRRYLTLKRPFEFRHVHEPPFLKAEKRPPFRDVWFRAVDRLPDDEDLHRNFLAYVSDYELLGTATMPHGLSFGLGNVQMASLDHALWFHRPARLDDWLLYHLDSPNSGGARGLARGQIFSRDGMLVASTAQEGLIRIWPAEQSS